MWITDGSPGMTVDDDIISNDFSEWAGDTNSNALWVSGDGLNSGEHYWTIIFGPLEGTCTAIGLSNKERFADGYELRGLMYGGNLHNGGALLVQQFGPPISSNDRMGILASFSEEVGRLRMYIFQNGEPLGLAFDVAETVLPNIHPVVRLSSGSAKIRKETEVPKIRCRKSKSRTGTVGSSNVPDPFCEDPFY